MSDKLLYPAMPQEPVKLPPMIGTQPAVTLPDDVAKVVEEAGKVLEGVTEGPWRVDGEPWNQIVWSGADNRVCFMAHSNGLDDDRDVATARFIAWCREGVPALIAFVTAQAAQIAGLEKERDELATANHRQASCIHVTAANLGPDCSATVDGLPKAARHVAAERDALLGAVKGLVEVLDQHETKGPLPDTALMFCWLAAQNVRSVLRGYMLEKPE